MSRARIFLTLLALGGPALAGGCGDDEDRWPAAFTDPGDRFEVEVGDRFVVVLESNLTTGYGWELEVAPPPDLVRLVDDVYVAPEAADLAGAPGRQELTFEAVGEGATDLRLWYVRSFDDPPDPADRARFEVVVVADLTVRDDAGPGGTLAPP